VSVVLLPRASDPDGTALARAKLAECIGDKYAAVMIVNGEGPAIDAVVEMGSARAVLDPMRRTVVWLRDKSVLTKEQRDEYAPAGSAAVFIGLQDSVVETLSPAKGAQKYWVEKAFSKAGG
jgi:hypothetical protein